MRPRVFPGAIALALSITVLGTATAARAQMPPTSSAPPGMAAGQGMPPGMSGMPDARMMSGIPMPMGDLPDASISVRLVRGDLSNPVAGHTVTLTVDGKTQTAKTDETGRAQFTGLAPGASAKASASVEGESLESQPFQVPAKGGVRLLLAASPGGASSAANLPAVTGRVTLSRQSRIAIEFDDAALSVFYLLEIANNAASPVNPASPVAFELPAEATSAALMDGSSPQAQVKGRHVTVAGPFKPGVTTVQIAYQLTPTGSDYTIVQPFPLAFEGLSIAVQKPGAVQMRSPQLAEQRDMPGDGRTYIVGSGPALAAGRPVTIELTNLPHHETWPRNVAVAIALLVLGAGLWMALGRPAPETEARRRLEARREQLFSELLRVEQSGRGGAMDESRRAALLMELERVYGELDRGHAAADKGTAA